jgi:cytochrome c biogenesis protein CcmG/thiol:disulfide interchange protein DsbE
MRFRIFLLAGLLAAVQAICAGEEQLPTLKVGDEVYSKVTITSVTTTDVYFTHTRGLGTAKLKDLTPEMQRHFHFDPAKAAVKQSELAQANALYTKTVREAPAPRKPPEMAPGPAEPGEEIPPHPIYAKSFLNQHVPNLTIEKWLTDPPEIQGKFVLVDFWATWCGPCRRSIPILNDLQARFKERLVVIGLSNESEEVVRRMTEPKIDYAVAVDTQGRTSRAAEVKGIPHTILVDPKGIVRFEGMPHFLTPKAVETLLARYAQ